MEEKKHDVVEAVQEPTRKEREEEPQETPKKPKQHLPAKRKLKKHDEALMLVEEAKAMVKEAEEQTEACKLLLEGDLKAYEEAKAALRDGGMDACEMLLEKLGAGFIADVVYDENIVVVEPKEDVEPIVLKDVSSGKFTGFIYALLGGAATAAGLVYLATQKLGIRLDITKMPSVETMEKILSWFSSTVGMGESVYIGGALLAGASLLVMVVIYLVRVTLKGSKNLHFAVKQLVEAELYCEKKGDCKAEMDRVDAHMKETVELLKTYKVLFNEQKGKLERILHIEGIKAKSSEYHEKSFVELHETKEMLRTIKEFIATPMTEQGKLSEKSVNMFRRTKTQLDKILERLY